VGRRGEVREGERGRGGGKKGERWKRVREKKRGKEMLERGIGRERKERCPEEEEEEGIEVNRGGS
jgi:hypothetical protein